MSIFVNRTLNLKSIKAIGFDMDHTIVRYQTENFERYAYEKVVERLVETKNYPKGILKLKFDFERGMQGLVIDKKEGNLLKLSRFSRVKQSYHGTRPIDFKKQKTMYQGKIIDLNDPHMLSLDTAFALSNAALFADLVDYKEDHDSMPSFEVISDDIREMIDMVHADGTLKSEVHKNPGKYIVKDPDIPKALEKLKKYGKKLFVVTNSEYPYTQFLLDYAITPFLKEHKSWMDLFEFVVVAAQKPRFFTDNLRFLKIDPNTGLMSNTDEKIEKGVFQGGNARKIQKDLELEGDEILYMGDHIYGDVVALKKTCNWRTALVLEPLIPEIEGIKKGAPHQHIIEEKMKIKEVLEMKINDLYADQIEKDEKLDRKELDRLFKEIEENDKIISENIVKYQHCFNPYWGEIMRAGQEESRFAGQVAKYACIYMSRFSDFVDYSPRKYFRPMQRLLPHELV